MNEIELEYSNWPLIEFGYGEVEVAKGSYKDKPAIIFGKNGTGVIGERTKPDRVMTHEETLSVVTFENVESIDVVIETLKELRCEYFLRGEVKK